MRLLRLFLILFLCLSGLSPARAGSNVDSLWSVYKSSKDQEVQIGALLSIAEQYDLSGNIAARDSMFDVALEYIRIDAHDSLQINILNRYFQREEEYLSDRAEVYAKHLRELAGRHNNNKWTCDAYMANAKLNLFLFKNDRALENASQAYYYASLTDLPDLKVKSMLLFGNCLERNNKKIEAFKKYSDALYLSRKIEHPDLIFDCYQNLSAFYSVIYNIAKAKEYQTEQLKLLYAQRPLDSVKFIQTYINMAALLFDNNEKKAAEKITNQVLSYAFRHNYSQLKQRMFVAYRTYLINNGYFKELSDLYINRYPDELKEIAQNNPALYLRLKAFIAEANNNPDSAEYFYSQAEVTLLNKEPDNVYMSNFYKRYGEFLMRRGDIPKAEDKLSRAYQFAEVAQYLPYLTEITHELDSLNYAQGRTDEAYKYAKLNLLYTKQSELVHQEEELLKLEVENEARGRELSVQREIEETERRYNIQYMGISLLIVFSFIVLAMIGSFRVHKFVVKAVGFFTFIFFFEFIIMLADHKIHHITHGEPWKFLAFKIGLIAILLPLHHWLEEKVIHYLVSHKLVDPSKISIKSFSRNLINNLLQRKPGPVAVTKEPDETGMNEIVEQK